MFEKYLRKFISIQQKFLLFSVVNDGAEVSELGCFFSCSFQARSQNCVKLRHLCPPAWNNSFPIAQIFIEFDI
jgi:hypothetical protein